MEGFKLQTNMFQFREIYKLKATFFSCSQLEPTYVDANSWISQVEFEYTDDLNLGC